MAKDTPSVPGGTSIPGGAAGPGGIGGAGCPAGGASEGCPLAGCTIVSQTEHDQPPNRSRTKIGVGERVGLRVDPGPATWSVGIGGELSSESGTDVTFTAGEEAANATITAEVGGKSCSIQFEIVAPEGLSLERLDDRGFYHRQGKPSAGFVGRVHLLPADVNFDACEYKEEDVAAEGEDRCDFMDGQGHHPNPNFLPISSTVVPGRGSQSGIDTVKIRMTIPGSLAPGGTVTWSIPWLYRCSGGLDHPIATIDQVARMDDTGTVTISKGGASVTKEKSEPNSTMDETPPVIE